ncbi:MAG: SDR family oxidoreductase [Ilumatobacteraceae bacterium]
MAKATAERFVAEGGSAVVVDLDASRAEAVAASLGDRAVGLGADVSDETSVNAVAAGLDRFGRLDAVLNAAGHAEFGPIEEWSVERWNRMMTVPRGRHVLVCRCARRAPLHRESIVNIASTAALTANNNSAPYAPRRGDRRLQPSAVEEAAPDVRVNCVAPGRTAPGMTEPLFTARGATAAEGEQRFAQGILLGRLGEASELAAPICFLLSSDASFMTGSLMVVDGGETAV